jgi:hypothetical protein
MLSTIEIVNMYKVAVEDLRDWRADLQVQVGGTASVRLAGAGNVDMHRVSCRAFGRTSSNHARASDDMLIHCFRTSVPLTNTERHKETQAVSL